MFDLSHHQRRRAALTALIEAEPLCNLLPRRIPGWDQLDEEDRSYLKTVAVSIAIEKGWEATHGFELSDEMILVIASQAALMLLGLQPNVFDAVRNIVVSPRTMTLEGERATGSGFRTRDPQRVLGHTAYDGNVYVAWDSIDVDVAGCDSWVVLHEFAHQLDHLDGVVNGTPPMRTSEQLARWVEVCTGVFEAIRAGNGPDCIRDYAGESAAEFFPTVTEVFFGNPDALKAQAPSLYEVFADYYGQET